jgi:hypothetical protein
MLEAIRSKSEAGLTRETIGAERGSLKFAAGVEAFVSSAGYRP